MNADHISSADAPLGWLTTLLPPAERAILAALLGLPAAGGAGTSQTSRKDAP